MTDVVRPDTSALLAGAGFPVVDDPVIPVSEHMRPIGLRKSALPALLWADTCALVISILAGQLISAAMNPGTGTASSALESVSYVLIFLAVMACYGLYRRGRRRLVGSSFPDFGHLIHSLVVGSLVVLLVAGALHRWIGLPNVDRTSIVFTGLLAVALVPQTRALARWMVRRSAGAQSRVLIVGSGVVASRIVARLKQVDGVQFVGCVDDNVRTGSEPWEDIPLLGSLDSIPRVVAEEGVDHVIVAFSPVTGAKLASVLRSLARDVQISIVPRLFDLLTVRSHVDDLHGLPVVDVAPASLGPAARFAKRALDIAASGFGLLVLSPLLLAVAVAVKVTSPGPILFSQRRTGRGGKPFEIHKFRTMRLGAETQRQELVNEVDGPLFKVRDDPRVTSVGRLLRKTSLDELPQLFNVLGGTMSLVGPRPFITAESDEIAGWAARRFDVRPGMTGLWQISGRNDLPFDELCRLDYSYVASWSLWWDVRILWHTPGMVIRSRGAY